MEIVVTSPMDLSTEQKKRLENCGEVTYHNSEPETVEEWLERCHGFKLVCAGKSGMTWPLSKKDTSRLGIYHLRQGTLVSHPFVNVAMISKEELRAAGVRLSYAPGSNRQAVSEWAMAMLLELFRNFSQAVNLDNDKVKLVRTKSLSGKSIAILGMGAVGQEVARLAEAFGMLVRPFHRRDNLYDTVHNVDVVVNCLSSLEENKGMLDQHYFAAMSKGSFFVTMTNPAIWDIDALLDALDSGHLAGAAIDIGNKGPGDVTASTYQKVAGHSRVLATPQIAHFSDLSASISFDMMIENIEAASREETPPYLWA